MDIYETHAALLGLDTAGARRGLADGDVDGARRVLVRARKLIDLFNVLLRATDDDTLGSHLDDVRRIEVEDLDVLAREIALHEPEATPRAPKARKADAAGPLKTWRAVALAIGVHRTTVSAAIKGKGLKASFASADEARVWWRSLEATVADPSEPEQPVTVEPPARIRQPRRKGGTAPAEDKPIDLSRVQI